MGDDVPREGWGRQSYVGKDELGGRATRAGTRVELRRNRNTHQRGVRARRVAEDYLGWIEVTGGLCREVTEG